MTRRSLRVLALDLSFDATGWASVWARSPHPDLPVPAKVQVGTLRSGVGLCGDARNHAIMGGIHALVQAYQPELVLVERKLAAPGRTGGALEMAGLHGVVGLYLWPRVPYVLIQQAKVKVYATGRGAKTRTEPTPSKAEVALCVERRWGELVTVQDDNQADAMTMAAMACDYYEMPLAPMPLLHRRALEGITWPELGPTDPEPGDADTAVRRPARPGRQPTGV